MEARRREAANSGSGAGAGAAPEHAIGFKLTAPVVGSPLRVLAVPNRATGDARKEKGVA